MALAKQCAVEADRGYNNHFEAGDPASVVEWRGRPRFKNPMALAKQCAVEADRHFKFISKRVIPRRWSNGAGDPASKTLWHWPNNVQWKPTAQLQRPHTVAEAWVV